MLVLSRLIDATPPLPMSVAKLHALQGNPDRSIKEVAQIVESDPVLSAKIMGLINSPAYGMRNRITTVTTACAQLGETAIFSLAILVGLHNRYKFDLSPYGMSERDFLFNTLMQMNLMNEWIRYTQPPFAEELRLAAFLSDIGRIVISRMLIEKGLAAEFKARLDSGVTERNVELAMLGCTSIEVSSAMLQHWGVNDRVVAILRYTSDAIGAPDELKVPTAMMESVHNLWRKWKCDVETIRQESVMGFALYEPAQYPNYEQAVANVLDRISEMRSA